MAKSPVIYLDYQSTTPTDPRVVEAMRPYFTEHYGNSHSRTHAFGWRADEAVEIAREHVAQLINAHKQEIVFTSGATESNNLAIKGCAHFYKSRKRHIVTVATEHSCVLESCRQLERDGFELTILPVNSEGIIDLELLETSIRADTLLVSIMAINNEIGVIQPLLEIGGICRKHNVLFHTDAAQAYGKMPLDVDAMHIDLLSISGHKFYAPKGVGALYVRRRPRVRLQPLFHGGGQERGLRPGTLPTPLVVGLGEAAKIASDEMQQEYERTKRLYKKLMQGIVVDIPGSNVNGSLEQRYYGNLNVNYEGVQSESLLMAIRELAVSTGSACASSQVQPSHVLHALGVKDEMSHTSIRFGIGRFTTDEEIDKAIDVMQSTIQRLRDRSLKKTISAA